MEWIKVKIYSDKNDLETLQSFLIDIGINGCTVEDSSDFLDFLQSKSSSWDYIDESLMNLKDIRSSVTAYLSDNSQEKRREHERKNSSPKHRAVIRPEYPEKSHRHEQQQQQESPVFKGGRLGHF